MSNLHYNQDHNGLRIQFSGGVIKLTPYTDRIIRVQYTLEPEIGSQTSLIVTAPPPEKTNFSVQETADQLSFSTDELTILINKQTAAFTYQDKAGSLLTKEPDQGGKGLTPTEVMKSVFDENTQIEAAQGVDGLRTRVTGINTTVDRHAYQTKLEFEWAEGEALYGLGSHEEGYFNLRGKRQYLYQQNMKAVVPILISTRGYGILYDSCSLMKFHDDEAGSFLWSEVDDELDFYFIYGPEFDQIIQGIRQLTGNVPMLPKWAFGYFQSKERYQTKDELIQIVDEYRRRNLPLDCIVLDWHSWPNNLWGQKTFDPARFPDPTDMMSELHNMNARLMVSIWPNMRAGGENWQEMQSRGYLLGNQANYDAFQPRARQLYWDQAQKGFFNHGIDAWWCDCTEPFEADWNGAEKLAPDERMDINSAEAKRYLDPEYINAYALLHSKGIYEGQRRETAEKRVVNLTRSAYAGQHRYGTITWSGDISATWETFRNQIPECLNFCATGSPYWTLDIGGYFVQNKPDLWFWSGDYDNGVADLGYRELYVRWFQLGAFLPIFRSHGTDIAREIWQFGEPDEPFYEALVKYLQLRYRLLPYIYSLAGMVTQQDYTILRALPFDFQNDQRTYDIADQFMFGPALMVCPVTHPMYYEAGSQPLENVPQTRSVYLPVGSDWYDFWTNQRLPGGQTITATAPLDKLPIFVRAGSIIPFGPDIQHAEEKSETPIGVRVYPGSDGYFEIYSDENDNYNYEQGEFAITPIEWLERENKLIFHDRQGGYPGMSNEQEFLVSTIQNISLKTAQKKIVYDGRSMDIKF